jgi:hypothetical protein
MNCNSKMLRMGNIFPKWSMATEGQTVTAKNIYCCGTFHVNREYTEAQSDSVLLTKPAGNHALSWFSHFPGQT